MAKNKKCRQDNSALVSILFMVLLGAALGILAGRDLFGVVKDVSFGEYLLHICWLILMLTAAFYVQLILHEGGHLVCGLLTGYRFVSFRIGSWMVQRENGKLCRHRYTLAGTGGQCLLAPPELINGKMPYRLYNLGGVLANLLAALAAGVLIVPCRDVWGTKVFFEMLCLTGIGIALTNGVPLRVQGIANDGANARDLGKDPAALRSLWVQLSINAKQADGVALRDMPEEWFTLPAENLDNIMVAALAVLYANRRMDERRFAETARAIDALEAQKTAILPLHRYLLLCDRLTCALLLGEDAAPLLKRWNSREMRAFRKQMKTNPAVLRTEYGTALLVQKNAAAARQFRDRFDRCMKTYPYAAEAESERALLHLLDEKAA